MSPGVTHPGGVVLVPKQPLGSPPVASVHSPRRHPRAGSPGSTRWHACHQPLAHACRCAAGPRHGQTRASRVRHTGVVTAARSGDGGGGAGADVPPCPHTGPTVPPAPRWHVPAQNPRRLAGAGGVTRTRCPCTHPHGRGDWSRGPGAGGGGSRHPLSCHLHPVPAPPILPPAQLPAVCGGGCGGEGGAGSCSPQDGWVELNPICFIIGHKARSPGCSPAG